MTDSSVVSFSSHNMLTAALAYARLGWRVIPLFGIVESTGDDGTITRRCACGKGDCHSSGKHPHGFLARNGLHAATTDESVIKSWFDRVKNINIGIACQPSGIVVLDLDPRNGGEFTLEKIEAEYGPLRADVMQFSGGGGRHYVFSYSLSGNLQGRLGNGIDIKQDGYIVASPSRHISGGTYEWEASSDPRDGVAPGPLPDWIRDLIGPQREKIDAEVSRFVSAETIADLRSALKAIPADDYHQWVQAGLALRACGGIGFELWDEWSQTSDKYAGHQMGPKWRSFKTSGGLGYESIFHWAAERGWVNPLSLGDQFNPVSVPAESVQIKTPKHDDPPELFSARIPGILGTVFDWIEATSRKPQPLFSTQAALAFGSIVLGRRYVSSANNWPSLYFLNIGKSASGKEHAKQAIEQLLEACQLSHLIGPNGYTSDSGVLSSLHRQPAHIGIIDEFGKVLEAASVRHGARAASAMRSLMEVFSRCDGTLRPQGYSTFGMNSSDIKKLVGREVRSPALTLLAMTTPETFFLSVGSAAARDGFLNRFLTVETDIGRQVSRCVGKIEIPDAITDWASSVREASIVQANDDPSLIPSPKLIQISAGAVVAFGEFDAWCVARMDEFEQDGLSEMFGRTNEIAMRVALIVAVSCQSQTVQDSHATWAIEYVRCHALRTVERLKTAVADSEFEDQMNKVLEAIRTAGQTGLTSREITRCCRKFRGLDVRGRNGVLAALADSGEIALVKIGRGIAANTNGPQREAWVAVNPSPHGTTC